MNELARALAFEEGVRERAVDHVEPVPYGYALHTPSLPRVWDLNNLRVDRGDGLSARALAADADRLQGAAGLAHRRVAILDEALGGRLAEEFASLCWRADRYLYMVRRRPPERDADLTRVVEVPWEAIEPVRDATIREGRRGYDAETVRQLREATVRFTRAGNARHFAVLAEGKVVTAADLYSDGATAQVEDVVTVPEHRGRGHAAAVILRAVAEAQAAGHDFVFLTADDNDWPKHLYRRLGFDEVGRKWAFLKPPPELERESATASS
ncbi:MAG: GNAT family N-acetyltransferase [Actinobacteria bacterium]|nr:GNAT family N-acetyltransferase [Actinomycetota bacterium]